MYPHQQQPITQKPSLIQSFFRSTWVTLGGFAAVLWLFFEQSGGDVFSLLHWSSFICYISLPMLGFANFIGTRFPGVGILVSIPGVGIFLVGIVLWFITYS
jgi:hypothetical protein